MKILGVLVCLLLAALAGAQTVPVPITPVPAGPLPPPDAWNSPQATVQAFIQDMKAGKLFDARKAMDLSDVSFPVRDTLGDQFAGYLSNVLTRIRGLNLQNLPATESGRSYAIPVTSNGREVGALVLEKSESGAWRFSASTVEQLPHLYRAVQFEPQDNGLGVFADPQQDPAMDIRAILPSWLLHSFLWFEVWQWFGFAILIFLSMVVAAVARAVVRLVLLVFFKRVHLNLAAFTEKSLRRSIGLLAGFSLWRFTYEYLGFDGASFVILIVLMKVFAFVAIAWVADAVFDLLMDTIRAQATTLVQRADDILIPIAKKFVRFIIFLLAALGFAASMSVNIAGLIAGLGIGGLVLALAGKDSVENIFGSLTIIFDMPFGIGDYIKMSGAEGTVEEINLRSTRIRTGQDTLITMPNSNLIKASVENFTARRARQFAVTLPLSYVNDDAVLATFCDEARAAVKSLDQVRPEDANLRITSIDAQSLGLRVELFFITDSYGEEMLLREKVIATLVKVAKDAKVVLGAASWSANLPNESVPIPGPKQP